MGTRSGRRGREETLRFIAALLFAAVAASAATSAVFLAARSAERDDSLAVSAASAQRLWEELTPSLETAAHAEASRRTQNSDALPEVQVEYSERSADEADLVPMASGEEQTVSHADTTAWRMRIDIHQREWNSPTVVDIQRSASLKNPGFLAVVQFEVAARSRQSTVAGRLPVDPPSGYEVITPARYNELVGSQQFKETTLDRSVYYRGRPAIHLKQWTPADPPPAELPPAAQERFTQAVLDCLETPPNLTTKTETVNFYYSLRDGQWTPRP